ncbi:MAG: L,D-transpeptidase [Gemmatimonadota bacterium]|jgi:lipoprotein-anchoring transpeptidase ErfK/SrfK
MRRSPVRLVALAAALGCAEEKPDAGYVAVSVPLADEGMYDPAALEAERLDRTWWKWAERDRLGRRGARSPSGRALAVAPAVRPAIEEEWEQITPLTTERRPVLPVAGGAGPSVLHIQILLDRVGFSPGVIDGRWGKNTEKAVYWFQQRHGLETTGSMDTATYARLARAAGVRPLVERYTLTAADLDGPFVDIPEDVYERAELECLCYRSAWEKLAERFHAAPELLERLNPTVEPNSLDEGTILWVPAVRRPDEPPSGTIARIVVSKNGYYTHALDAGGRIVLHFPSTLGSSFSPSPDGELSVTSVTFDPHFHYQPELFHEVPDEEPDAMLPPGPNSPVGVVWMQLSEPHYGIHGTSEPETIGYATSHGCVRLTNWDARLLAQHTRPGTPVEFR